ncbi:MAG: hypothetical protein P4N41_16690 [Negativicutes bacterium]|nr:hypothetical protein [Negativicutes bacterium]MDR3591293.1 hypothetical protein [Negativicutes bacterium]
MRKVALRIVLVIVAYTFPLLFLHFSNGVVFVLDTIHYDHIATDGHRSISYDPNTIEVYDDYIAVGIRVLVLDFDTKYSNRVEKHTIFFRPTARTYKVSTSVVSDWLPVLPDSSYDILLSAVLEHCRQKNLAAKPTPFCAPPDRIYVSRDKAGGIHYFLPATIRIEGDTIHYQACYEYPPVYHTSYKFSVDAMHYRLSDNLSRNSSTKLYDWQGNYLYDQKSDPLAISMPGKPSWSLNRGVFFYCRANGLLPDYPAIPPETQRRYLTIPVTDKVLYFVPRTVESDTEVITAQAGAVLAKPEGGIKQVVWQVHLQPEKNMILFSLPRQYDESGQLVEAGPAEYYDTFPVNSPSGVLFNALVAYCRENRIPFK